MKGTIHAINKTRGMAAVKTANGDYSIFELLNDESLEIGDVVFWKNDTGMGSETLKNLTQNLTFEVYFQNHLVTESNLRNQLLI